MAEWERHQAWARTSGDALTIRELEAEIERLQAALTYADELDEAVRKYVQTAEQYRGGVPYLDMLKAHSSYKSARAEQMKGER